MTTQAQPRRAAVPEAGAQEPPLPFLARPVPFFALMAVLVLATLGALVFFPVVLPVPLLGMVVLWALWKAPLRYPAFILFVAVLSLDCPPEIPYEGEWKSPLYFPGWLLFENLNNVTGVRPLSFNAVDLLVIGLVALFVYRRATRSPIDVPTTPVPQPLVFSLLLLVVTILWMEAWGMLRGGDRRASLWQFHQVFLLPFMVMLFNATVRGPEDFRFIARAIVTACIIKAFLSAYFINFIVRPRGLVVEYATQHSDTLIYVPGLMIAVATFAEAPSWARFRRMVVVSAIILMGMSYNDRRLAYVSFNLSLVVLYILSPWHRVKRYLTRGLIFVVPLFPLYVSVGWKNPTGIFSPVSTFKSIIEGENLEQGQMDYRDMENINVVSTWQKNPVLGSGYGHPFDEVLKMPDISHAFEDYLYHPHNSVLGMFAFGGVVGFSGLWMHLAVIVFLAVRAYRFTHPPEWRAAMLVAIGVVVAYTNQCFGDMGNISWQGTFLVAMAATCAGKLAIRVKAWPDPRAALLPRASPAASPPSEDSPRAVTR